MNNTTKIEKGKRKIIGVVVRSNGAYGHVIGQVINDTGYKDISGEKHFLHYPYEAIAFTVDALNFMQENDAVFVEILDTDTGIKYKTTIQNYFEHGEKFNFGFGEQIKLSLSAFTRTYPQQNETNTTALPVYHETAIQLSLFEGAK